MDVTIRLDPAIRDTIHHLNENYSQYETALPVYRELGHLGRLFALVLWLQETNADKRVELDELLSVMLPAFATPDRTQKMLAVSAAVYSRPDALNTQNVRDYARTYDLSDLIVHRSPCTSDSEFIRIAQEHYSNLDRIAAYPTEYRQLKGFVDDLSPLIEASVKQLEVLEREIETGKAHISRASSIKIDRLNDQVARYNRLLIEHQSMVDRSNAVVEQLNRMDIAVRYITSIGGGISLSSRSFRQTQVDSRSPRIRAVHEVKHLLQPTGRVAIHGDWIRSNPGPKGARVNPLPMR